ncbi:Trp biosynthesis-associated membrane protein [Kineosporia sp. R_H_3]|uniref:Trp biosynthesis-associated membrane protein n=1 Tax=Kineosporia sp. R_H_3 TaxID=1961848 RepID=UPI0013047667|nr:Trp biosynthesis-associated membrane protein [Kineosporia sp. R_H_3]
MRSSKGAAALLVVLGGLLAILAGGRTWLSVTPVGATVSAVNGAIPVSGREAAPAGSALGLVALAGAVALLTSGLLVRYVVAVLLALCGAGLVAVPMSARADGFAGAAADAVARATGARITDGGGFTASTTVWPSVCAAAGLLVLAGAVVALLRARTWAGPSRRYEVPAVAGTAAPAGAAGAGAATARDRAYDAWDALSEGGDPTADDAPRP